MGQGTRLEEGQHHQPELPLNIRGKMMENQKERKTATKSRILFLLRYLFENTDDEHAVSTNDLIASKIFLICKRMESIVLH